MSLCTNVKNIPTKRVKSSGDNERIILNYSIYSNTEKTEKQYKDRRIYIMDKIFDNNQVNVFGEVVSDFKFSHEVLGEGFYIVNISIKRLSNACDVIPLMVSERLIDVTCDYKGKFIEASGQFRSYNKHGENHNHLILSVFVRNIQIYDENIDCDNNNFILLDGFICKQPVYRETPLGRAIADVLLAVNRPHGKSDYIPCVCWGRNAKYAGSLEVGTHIKICGRVQSREYQKKIDDEKFEKRIAYEVSINTIDSSKEELDENNN